MRRSRDRRLPNLLAAIAVAVAGFLGCSCRSTTAAATDGGSDRTPGDTLVPPGDGEKQTDASRPDGIVWALDVPWGTDDTRQLTPVEIPPAVAGRDCGPDCTQVTFLPGWPGVGAENRYNVNGNLLVTNAMIESRLVAVYVDLTTGKAFAFGVIAPTLQSTNAGCYFGVVDTGRVAYACTSDATDWPGDGKPQAELRVFTPATGQERRVWKQPAGGPYGNPNSPGFAAMGVTMIESAACELSCNAWFVILSAGGAPAQVFPPIGKEGGVGEGHASDPYLVWTDTSHFPPHVEVAYTTVADGNAPAVVSSAGLGDRFAARIKGPRVAWMDTRNDPEHGAFNPRNVDIYAKDLVTGEEWAACTDVARQEQPDVEGDIVVWTDFRNSSTPYPTTYAASSDVYAANVRTGQEWRLTSLPGLAIDVRIDGGRAFFFWSPDDTPSQICIIDLKARGVVP
ncbi:MAG: hypothetical protein HY906_11665 [Deltaproteobacteria bacterium]|nr:hypothetical protein [Deltaproteobacteria bacterium]